MQHDHPPYARRCHWSERNPDTYSDADSNALEHAYPNPHAITNSVPDSESIAYTDDYGEHNCKSNADVDVEPVTVAEPERISNSDFDVE